MSTAETHPARTEGELTVPVFDEDDLITGPDFTRHLADIARPVVSMSLVTVTVGAALFSPRAVRSASLDLVRLVLLV